MERSKRSLNVRMRHGDDDGINKAQTRATVCAQLSRKTIKGQRHQLTTKRETTKTKDLQCMMTHALASTTLTLTCSPNGFKSLHTLLGFALYFVSSIELLSP